MAWKVMPAVLRSASFRLSRFRSSISFSVTTVIDCGMSRRSCEPLPMRVSLLRRLSLPEASACAFTLIGASVVSFGASGSAVWALALPKAKPKPAARAP